MSANDTPFEGGYPPEWATEWGHDRYGYFTAFEIGGVMQRLRWIPRGVFLMGSPEDEVGRHADEGPCHEVELTRGYWLGETPVTQSLWSRVMGSNPSHFQSPSTASHPVESVSWDSCHEFIQTVNERVPGLSLCLPTEAEWERACRGGTDGPTWLGTNDAATLDKIAWYSANSGGRTHAVREKAANPFGLYDVLGNVLEWCDDSPRKYTAARVVDPHVVHISSKVCRGGSWDWGARVTRAGLRVADPPSNRLNVHGFRVSGGPDRRASKDHHPEPRSRGGATWDAVTTSVSKGKTR